MPGIPPSLPPAIICVVTGVAAKCAKRRLAEAARQLAQIDLTARIAVNARCPHLFCQRLRERVLQRFQTRLGP